MKITFYRSQYPIDNSLFTKMHFSIFIVFNLQKHIELIWFFASLQNMRPQTSERFNAKMIKYSWMHVNLLMIKMENAVLNICSKNNVDLFDWNQNPLNLEMTRFLICCIHYDNAVIFRFLHKSHKSDLFTWFINRCKHLYHDYQKLC